MACLLEFKEVEAVRAIVIHKLEDALQPDYATRTAHLETISEQIEHVLEFLLLVCFGCLLLCLLVNWLLWRIALVFLRSLAKFVSSIGILRLNVLG